MPKPVLLATKLYCQSENEEAKSQSIKSYDMAESLFGLIFFPILSAVYFPI